MVVKPVLTVDTVSVGDTPTSLQIALLSIPESRAIMPSSLLETHITFMTLR